MDGDIGVDVGVVAGADVDAAKILFDFGIPRAPGDVVDVAEGVDVDCVYVCWGEEEVLK